jgi:hypothetical protein
MEGFPSSAAYRHRFGSLVSAYRLIGYTPDIDYAFIEINRYLRKKHPEIVAAVIQKLEALGAVATWDDERCRSRKLTRECSGKVIKWGERGGGVSLSKEVGPEADGVDLEKEKALSYVDTGVSLA